MLIYFKISFIPTQGGALNDVVECSVMDERQIAAVTIEVIAM